MAASVTALKSYCGHILSPHREQDTVDRNGGNITIQIKGRHDPIIVPRAVVVVESMTAITVLDMLLQNMTSRVDRIKTFYGK